MDTNQNQDELNTETGKGFSPLLLVGGLIVVGIIGVTVMNMSKKSGTAQPEVSPSPLVVMESSPAPVDAAAPEVMMKEGEVRTITIEAGSFYYKPAEIRVKKGEKVKLVMNSVDMMHDFNIDELGVKIPIAKAGETATVEFTPDKVGEFEYYCSVGEHRKNGQVGTIIVE